jgi:hypothetical protein
MKFHILDAKQLLIALTSAFSTWAATGFQHDAVHLTYILIGFITGGLVSHDTMANPNIAPESHIQTPYLSNMEDHNPGTPEPINIPNSPYKAEGTDVVKVIKINSGLLK